jgi:hypothetical protein
MSEHVTLNWRAMEDHGLGLLLVAMEQAGQVAEHMRRERANVIEEECETSP